MAEKLRKYVYREADIEVVREEEEDEDSLPKRLSVVAATDSPINVFGVEEVLSMKRNAADLSRLKNDAPFLANHNSRDILGSTLGKVTNARILKGELLADVELARTDAAKQYAMLVRDGFANKISIGFRVDKWELTRPGDHEKEIRARYTALQWQPQEVSAVSVPADDDAKVTSYRYLDEKPTLHNRSQEMATEAEDATETETVDVAKVEARAAAQVRDNAKDLLDLGKKFEERGYEGSMDVVHEAISNGYNEKWVRGKLDELVLQDREETQQNSKIEEVGMTEKETRNFSILRLIRHQTDPEDKELREDAKLEIEACREAKRINRSISGYSGSGSFSLPGEFYNEPITRDPQVARSLAKEMVRNDPQLANRIRAVNVGIGGTTSSDGGENLVATVLLASSFIEFLYAQAVVIPRCVQMTGLIGNYDIPRFKTPPEVNWVEETKVSGYADSSVDFEDISLTPHKMYTAVPISDTALIQTTPAVEGKVRMAMARQKALKGDRACIDGAAADAKVPTGMLSMTDILNFTTGTDTHGIQPSLGQIFGMLGLLGENETVFGDTTLLCSPKMRFHMSTIPVDAGSGRFLWDWNGTGGVAGFPAATSNNLPKTTAARGNAKAGDYETIMYFAGSAAMWGTWGTDDVVFDRVTRRNQGYNVLSMIAHHDFQVEYQKSIVKRDYVLNVAA